MLTTERIKAALDQYWQKRAQKTYPASSIRASAIGHPCLRAISYPLVRPDLESKTPDVERLFHQGNIHEEDILKVLKEAGVYEKFKLIEAGVLKKWMIKARKYPEMGWIPVSGKVDAILEDLTDRSLAVVEVKAVSGNSFKQMLTWSKFWEALYRRKWYSQLQIYLFQMEIEQGFLIIKNRDTGEELIYEVKIDFEHTEELLQKAEEVWYYYTIKGELHPQKYEAPETCLHCNFAHDCLPNLEFQPLTVEIQETLNELLLEREKYKDSYKEYNRLDREIKKILNSSDKKEEGSRTIVGDFLIEYKNGRWKITSLIEEE